MRLFKLIIFLLVVGIIALFAYQNMATFSVSHNFVLDLKVRAPIEWSLKVYEILLISIGIGFFIGIVLLLKPWLGTRKTLSKVRKEKETLQEKLESYQGFPTPTEGKPAAGQEATEKPEERVIIPPAPEQTREETSPPADKVSEESKGTEEKPEEPAAETEASDAEEKSSQETSKETQK